MRAKTLLMLVALIAGFVSLSLLAEDASAKEKKCPIKRTVDCGGKYQTPSQPVPGNDSKLNGIKEIVGWTNTSRWGSNIRHYPDEQGACTISGHQLTDSTEQQNWKYTCNTLVNTTTHQHWRLVKSRGMRPVIIYEITNEGKYVVAHDFRSGDTQIAEEPKSPPSKPPVGKSGGDAGGGVLGDAIENGVRGIEKGIREKLKGFPKLP